MKSDSADAASGDNAGRASVPAERGGGALMERPGPSPLHVARGAGGLGLLWGGAWAGIGGVVSLAYAVLTGFPMELVPMYALNYGVVGLLCGAAFALVLTTMERRGSIEDLGYLRTSLWGAVGGFVAGAVLLVVMGALPAVGMGAIALEALRSAGLGAISAAATTALAKSGAGGGDGSPAASDHDGGM